MLLQAQTLRYRVTPNELELMTYLAWKQDTAGSETESRKGVFYVHT